MATLLTGSICLTDIPKEKITTSEKNGKKYLNITVWVNDTPDKYGNNASIQVSRTKEEREAKVTPVYIGNLKEPAAAAPASDAPLPHLQNQPPVQPTDDLPF